MAGSYRCGPPRRRLSTKRYVLLHVNGRAVDAAVSEAILSKLQKHLTLRGKKVIDICKLTPEAIESALEIQQKLENRRSASDNYFVLQVEKARYEAELAKKRYMNADPDYRLVCVELERLWIEKMGILHKVEEEF